MNGTSARMELVSETVACGENLRGRVFPDPSAPDAGLTLELLWRTSGLCKAEEKVVLSQPVILSSAQEIPFLLKIPAAGPMSYVGKTFSITWWVRIASANPAEAAFTVVPAARKTRLP